MRAICTGNADLVYTDERVCGEAFHKPDYAPDTLRSTPYMNHLCVIRRDLLEGWDGDTLDDLVFWATERAVHMVHVPEVLYERNSRPEPSAHAAAVNRHLRRCGLPGTAETVSGFTRVRYDIHGHPLISILIPTRDHAEDLQTCIRSIRSKTTYDHYEIIVIDNGSQDAAARAYLEELRRTPGCRVLAWNQPFNFSAICNYGASQAEGDYLVLLNNDTEVRSPDWLQEMLMFAQRPDVGAVGARLLYPDGTIQHAGIGIGLELAACHYFKGLDGHAPGYMGRLQYAQNVSAVTGACMMVPTYLYRALGELDESFPVAFNDVDFCLRLRQQGFLIVFTPYAELTHFESKTRGAEKRHSKRFHRELTSFLNRWREAIENGDPYYNRQLSRDGRFGVEM